MTVSVIMYKRLGISNDDIAFYTSWLYLPWVIKPLWSPLVDALRTKRFWIVAMQLVIGAALAGVALTIPGPDFFRYSLAVFWLLAFSGATHDIAADGFYILALNDHQQATFVGIRSTFYRIAMVAGQGLLVMLAGHLETASLLGLGGNITALEIDGTFDDCQAMVKSAFLDRELSANLNLTSANSINLSRLVPQSFYYIHAARQMPEGVKPVFVVPSGNFGNLTAGLLAMKLGLPVEHFVAATNANDVVPDFLQTGIYQPRASVPTISNAMDVGAPSNFVRMQALFDGSWEEMKSRISGASFTDDQTRAAIREVKSLRDYVIDPHGAVGWLAGRAWRAAHPCSSTITLETAHPAKFPDVIEAELGIGSVEIPERLAVLADRPKSAIALGTDKAVFRDWLLAH